MNAGSGGSTLATDDITSVHYQINKLAFGALDTATLVTGTVGLPIAQDGSAWTIGTVTTVSTVTNLAQMGGVAISLNTGVRDAGTRRVTIATNDLVPVSQSTAAAGTAGWPVTMGNVAVGTAAWTSVTALNTALTATVTNYSTVTLGLGATSTMTGGVLTFEADDGSSNWSVIQGRRTDTGVIETTSTLAVITQQLWQFNVTGMTSFRVRLSTVITGTGTANLRLLVGAASENTATIGLATGTNTIGALTSNQSVNVAQINGVATTMGNGVSGTGVQRVTIASDSTANIATIGTSITPGTAAANLGKAEDAVHASGDVGVLALAVRDDTPTISSGTEGDYEVLHTASQGHLWTRSMSEGGQGATVPVYSHHVPAVNAQATINRAAAGAGVRNVCLGFSVSLTAGSTAPTAAVPVTVALIDGIAGGTTYLWRQQLGIPTTVGVTQGFVVDGWFEGTAATQMTLEFSAAGGANTFEVVSMRTIQVTE